jgi:ABC-2 type transport system permease protein
MMPKLLAVETRLYLRDPMTVFWGVAFPVLLLVALGVIPGFREPSEEFGGHRVIDIYVPILIVFALATLAVGALPTVLASYREKGVLRRLSTTPVNPVRLLAAQLVVNAALTVVALGLVVVVARIAFDVGLPERPLLFLLALLLSGGAVLAIGMFIAAVAPSARAANGIGLGLAFPMWFFAGLYVPREVMPELLRQVSDLTPLGAAVGALQAAAQGDPMRSVHVVVLVALALGFGLAAGKLFRWE